MNGKVSVSTLKIGLRGAKLCFNLHLNSEFDLASFVELQTDGKFNFLSLEQENAVFVSR